MLEIPPVPDEREPYDAEGREVRMLETEQCKRE